ncbi:MAG: F0F1 ATP synthase subunit alpha [Clostridiales bacterium]|jgi:F-type H+-transporting ATPase subunit alpha|nr:F0F1 ATP synthase subunit alpha [Clostridiales bacterium]
MVINPEEITSIIRRQIENYGARPITDEAGTVISAGDGIARVYGLSGCMSGELLRFENGALGMAVNLEEDNIGCVLLGDEAGVKEGGVVKREKTMASVPVGEELLGRVVNALGDPIDGKGPLETQLTRPIEFPAPTVNDRKSVSVPLQTGIMAVDAMIPIGRGQRELIIGDRQTGKTSIAIDTIINQKDKGVFCVYVAIGQKKSTVASIASALERHGALENTIIVNSAASDPAAMQYIAPYSGCAMAEEFMYDQHKDVLIVYDDLSKHAVAYRAMSLLLRRPPGREAYPGDVFYLHSRLLERAARLSDARGGGSMTALPVIETQGGDFSAYIPTNVVSITDGQIYLQPDLFFSGQRPAVNVGISVSRVGGAAQTKAIKSVSGSLRISLAQYRDLEVFAQFGSDLDKATREKLTHGERLVETLKQPNYSPLSMEEQTIILFLATSDALMDIPLADVKRFNAEYLIYARQNYAGVINEIASTGQLSPENASELKKAAEELKEIWK